MRDNLQVKHTLWAWLACMWSASAWAAEATFVSDLSSIPPAAVAVAVVLSLIGGATSMLGKIASPAVTITNLRLVVVSDLLYSLTTGLVVYFLCAHLELPRFLQAACITVASYGGSRVLERLLGGGLAKIDSTLGVKPPESTP